MAGSSGLSPIATWCAVDWPEDLAPTAPVEKVMSTPAVTIGAEADLHSAFKLFRTHAVRRLAVVDFDDFVGMITVDDLLVDLAADLFDLARPIAAESSCPPNVADGSRRIWKVTQ